MFTKILKIHPKKFYHTEIDIVELQNIVKLWMFQKAWKHTHKKNAKVIKYLQYAT